MAKTRNIPFGDYLRERRQDEGLSIRAFARKAGMSTTKVFHVESGATEFRQSDLVKMARVFGELPSVFLGIHENYPEWRRQRALRLKELNESITRKCQQACV